MRVVLATDGSKDANGATEWLGGSPLPLHTTMLVLTVATLPDPPIDVQTMKDLRDAILADARRVGEAARTLLAPRWPNAEVRVSEGDPREEIFRTAEEWGAGQDRAGFDTEVRRLDRATFVVLGGRRKEAGEQGYGATT